MADDQTEQLVHLTDRYGRGTSPTRGVVTAIAAALVLLMAGVGWMIYESTDEPVQAALHSWDEPHDGVLPTTVEIRRDAGVAVTCDLVAVDLRQIVVGQLELEIPAGPEERFRVTADIPLEGDGVAPKLRGCHPLE